MKQKLKELRASLQIKKGLASLRSGSVLVFTLIILFIILATALSIAGVTVIERKTSSSTGKSTASFQIADSGTEIFLKRIKDQPGSTLLSSVPNLNCTSGNNSVTGSAGNGSYAITFFDSSDLQLNCNSNLAQVDHIKSVGTLSGTSRAVEVALARTGCDGIVKDVSTSAGDSVSVSCGSGCEISRCGFGAGGALADAEVEAARGFLSGIFLSPCDFDTLGSSSASIVPRLGFPAGSPQWGALIIECIPGD